LAGKKSPLISKNRANFKTRL